MMYEEVLSFLGELWSENGVFKGVAVRNRDFREHLRKLEKEKKVNIDNFDQQLIKAVKKGIIERFLFDDGIHALCPHYRPANSEYLPYNEYKFKPYSIILQKIQKVIQEKGSVTFREIITNVNYGEDLVKYALIRLIKEGKVKRIPPKPTLYRPKKEV